MATTYTITSPSTGNIAITYSDGTRVTLRAGALTFVERDDEYVEIKDNHRHVFLDWTASTSPAAATKLLWIDAVLAIIQAAV
jgi:hypothetical protein